VFGNKSSHLSVSFTVETSNKYIVKDCASHYTGNKVRGLST